MVGADKVMWRDQNSFDGLWDALADLTFLNEDDTPCMALEHVEVRGPRHPTPLARPRH